MILYFKTNQYHITLFESGIRKQNLDGKYNSWIHKNEAYTVLNELLDTITLSFDKWLTLINYMKTTKQKQI
jgi:hypothetical protein